MQTAFQANAFQVGGPFAQAAYTFGGRQSGAVSTATFTATPIGPADANRRVVVIAYTTGVSAPTIGSITIGGASATIDVDLTPDASSSDAVIASLAVPTGTTADIVVNFTGTSSRCQIEVFSLTSLSAVPSFVSGDQTLSASASSLNRTLTATNGDLLVAGFTVQGSSASSENTVWTNANRVNQDSLGLSSRLWAAASAHVSNGPSVVITGAVQSGSSFDVLLLGAVYRATATSSAYSLTVTSSAVTLSGTSVNLSGGFRLSATTSAVTLTGSSVALSTNRRITVTSSAVTLTGSSANLSSSRKVVVSSSAVTLTGSSANLKVGRQNAVVSSAVTLTGSSVTLTYTPVAASNTLTVISGAVTLTGSSVAIRADRRIAVTSSAVTLTGSSVSLRASRIIAVTSSAITLSGSTVTLTYTPVVGAYTLSVTGGAITLAGSVANLTAVQAANDNTGGGYWREHKPEYRVHPEYDDTPKPKKKRRVEKEGQQVILAGDPEIQTGIIETRPAWDAMAELYQQRAEAEAIRIQKLRAIALADDEWLMVA